MDTTENYTDIYGNIFPSRCPECHTFVGRPMLTSAQQGIPQFCPNCRHSCEIDDDGSERYRAIAVMACPV